MYLEGVGTAARETRNPWFGNKRLFFKSFSAEHVIISSTDRLQTDLLMATQIHDWCERLTTPLCHSPQKPGRQHLGISLRWLNSSVDDCHCLTRALTTAAQREANTHTLIPDQSKVWVFCCLVWPLSLYLFIFLKRGGGLITGAEWEKGSCW